MKFVHVVLTIVCAMALTACPAGAQHPTYVNSLVVGGGVDDADGGSVLNSDGSAEFSGEVTIGSMILTAPLPITSGGTGADNAGDARSNLGLGTIATQDADSVDIDGGSITGITELHVADGSTELLDDSITFGLPNLDIGIGESNEVSVVPSTGDGVAGSTALFGSGTGSDGTTGNGGDGGAFVVMGGTGGDAFATSNGDGGGGGGVCLLGGNYGAGDGTGDDGDYGDVIACYNPLMVCQWGDFLVGTETPTVGKIMTVDGGAEIDVLTLGTALAIADGGTGAVTAPGARSTLGVAIGLDVQAYDAELLAIAGAGSAADTMSYYTGVATAATTALTAAARGLLDDANLTEQRETLSIGGHYAEAYGSGAAYTYTTTPALIDMSTADPVVTIDEAGTYLVLARVRTGLQGVTLAGGSTITLTVRRTNNTPAYIPDGEMVHALPVMTTETYSYNVCWFTIYTTANTDDVLEIWASTGVLPSAGALSSSDANLVAIRLF